MHQKKAMQVIFPSNFEQKIGFDKIRQNLKDNCLSAIGADYVDAISFMNQIEEIDLQTGLTEEFLRIIREHDNFPTTFYFDMRKSLNKIRIEGTFLEVLEVFDLKRSLETLKGIVSFFKDRKSVV